MAEKTHAELERHHYNEVRNNPQYATEGMMDVRMEEFSMNMLVYEPTEVVVQPEELWEKRQWNIVSQLRGEMLNLKKKFLDLEGLVTSKGYKPR